MISRELIRWSRAGVLLALVAGAVSPAWARPQSRVGPASPADFVVFIADDHGERDLGCYGHRLLRTPNIDRLAREGMRFDRAFLTTSSCSPSRSSILTGRYPHNTGAEDLHQPLPAGQKTLAHYLRRANYHCMAVGKWHLGDAEKRSWDRVIECPGDKTAENALLLLRTRPRAQPLFFWVASVDPHRPFDENASTEPHSPDDVVVPPYLPDHPLVRRDLAGYYHEIERFDRHIGMVLRELERQQKLDETFIVYLSDNGMPFPRAKTTLYDSGIRTPLLIRYPPLVARGSVQRGLVSSIDLAPTILAIAGIDEDTMSGRSLVPMLEDPLHAGREAIFAEANWHDFEKFTRAVRTERFLLIRNYYWDQPLWNSVDSINSPTWVGFLQAHHAGTLTPAQRHLLVQPRPFEELYDLQLDPASLRNVAGDTAYSESLNRLRTLLDNWRVETTDRMPETRRRDGWTRDGRPLPHNQPWYDRWLEQGGKSDFNKF